MCAEIDKGWKLPKERDLLLSEITPELQVQLCAEIDKGWKKGETMRKRKQEIKADPWISMKKLQEALRVTLSTPSGEHPIKFIEFLELDYETRKREVVARYTPESLEKRISQLLDAAVSYRFIYD